VTRPQYCFRSCPVGRFPLAGSCSVETLGRWLESPGRHGGRPLRINLVCRGRPPWRPGLGPPNELHRRAIHTRPSPPAKRARGEMCRPTKSRVGPILTRYPRRFPGPHHRPAHHDRLPEVPGPSRQGALRYAAQLRPPVQTDSVDHMHASDLIAQSMRQDRAPGKVDVATCSHPLHQSSFRPDHAVGVISTRPNAQSDLSDTAQ
jgi:hypothetical protein